MCPSCKSDIWKSAKMVVMEGTTNTKRNITETVTNAGKLCGSVRDLLLSDRWFSWDYPIEADLGLLSSTGLLQDVKRFMVEYGPEVQMPSPPPEPELTTSIKDAWKEVQEYPSHLLPLAPKEPTPSEIVEKPEETGKSTARSMPGQLLIIIVLSMASLLGANALFGNDILAVLSAFIIFLSFIIFATFKIQNRKAKIAKYEDKLEDIENCPESLEQYEKDRERVQKEVERFRIRYEESERNLSEYKKLIEEKRRAEQETAIYKKQLAEYEIKKLDVLKTRELLWERVRLCMRCGTAYLGPG